MTTSNLVLLPREQMDTQISRIDLLIAMYPSQDEITIDSNTTNLMDKLRNWTSHETELDDNEIPKIPSTVSFELTLDLDNPDPTESDRMTLSIEIPLKHEPGSWSQSQDLPPPLKARLRQPPWLTRTQTSQTNASIPAEDEDDILSVITHLCDEATKSLVPSTHPDPSTSLSNSNSNSTESTETQTLVRAWFYFPSLSTRTKRNDLVLHAPTHNLTGFVLAGKPGVLCLEGTPTEIDAYMRFIKTESWGDIPAYQKKVSERWREDLGRVGGGEGEGKGKGMGRVFTCMREITDAEFMGGRHGQKGNRGDLSALETWLDSLGLKGVFEKVLF